MPLESLSSQVDGKDGVRIIVAGELDVSCAADLAEAITSPLSAPEVARVGVDFAGVTFADSSALGSLVVAQNLAEQLGKRLELLNAPPGSRLRELLELSGLETIFRITD